MPDKVVVDGIEFSGHHIFTGRANILLIVGNKGFLGCGYFNTATADKLNEAVAIVRGVKNYEDMLNATVTEVSAAATAAGIAPGCSGREALLKLA